MKTALVIFNGIQFPYYLVDHAIDWSVKNDSGLHGLFVHSDKEPPEGYGFPSDINPAEQLFDSQQARRGNENVIYSQIIVFRDMARQKGVSVQTDELINPSLKDILDLTRGASVLFVDAAYSKSFILAATSFSFKDLISKSACPVELVHDKA